jgi:hypothetical protein
VVFASGDKVVFASGEMRQFGNERARTSVMPSLQRGTFCHASPAQASSRQDAEGVDGKPHDIAQEDSNG